MIEFEKLKPGNDIRIHYPESALVSSTPVFHPRTLLIRSVRDLWTEPLSIDEYLKRPFVRRGRWLVIGKETSGRRQHKQFYVASSKEHWRPALLRMGLFDPSSPGSKPIKSLSIPFGWTAADRLQLARVLLKWRWFNFDGRQLKVFWDDLKVKRAV